MKGILRVQGENIVNHSGERVVLKGINLGGWLMMEGYLLGGRNIPEHAFRENFKLSLGKNNLGQFTRLFRENFIRRIDFRIIKNSGFNCVRVPFNFRLIEEKNGIYYLDWVIRLCKLYRIYCILDLHAACGSQNSDWHADSKGEASLWKEGRYQEKLAQLWQGLARRYRDEETIAGFDILNEPVCKDARPVLRLYKELVSRIREIDKEHIIFLEGNRWAQELEFLGEPWDENLAYSIHFYAPLEFTFRFVRNLRYPGRICGRHYSKKDLKSILAGYYKIKKRWQVPIYVGEFGLNSPCPYCHQEGAWLKDALDLFNEFRFHWTYWTYKAVAGGIYPDGLYQYIENPAWVNRHEAVFGWETYFRLWKKCKKDIVRSWQTENFQENKALSALLTRP